MAESYEDKMKAMGEMSEEEVAKAIAHVKEVCKNHCGPCPSYEGTGETDFGFCAMGKSHAISEEKGCLCGGCPITDEMSLRWGYYCTRGGGREQAGIG